MHPGWHYPYHYHRGGPSRIIWFVVGGLATALWFKRKESHAYGHVGYCVRKPLQAPSSVQPQELPTPSSDKRTPLVVPQASNGNHAAWNFGQTPPFGWEEEKERMLALGRQAGDAMSDMSEATLDTVLSTVEALKVKLSEHRAQRQAEQKRLEQQLEEQRRSPKRWV